MAVIEQPKNLLPSPFCDAGDKTIIPGTGGEQDGHASYEAGFPPVTQRPLSAGGVAPQRKDFNGIFHMLSVFTFWQQSGGLMRWDVGLNYAQPCLVFHKNVLWWCIKDSGPKTAAGAKEPSEMNEAYWLNLLDALASMAQGGSGSAASLFGNPIGTYILYHGTMAPEGYFACDGSTFSATKYPKLYKLLSTTILPDHRGMFARGYDPAAKVDPDGKGRKIGSKQTDAGRNITGGAPLGDSNAGHDARFTGAFYVEGRGYPGSSKIDWDNPLAKFDASRIWGKEHTATEFRPANFSALWCIKHD